MKNQNTVSLKIAATRDYFKEVLGSFGDAFHVDTVSEAESAAWQVSGKTVDLLNVEPGGLVTSWVGE